MRRRLLSAVTGLSLLLCLAAVALWVRSYWRDDLVGYQTVQAASDGSRHELRSWMVASADGLLTVRKYWSLRTGDFVLSMWGTPAPGWHWETEDDPGNIGTPYHFETFGYSSRESDSVGDPRVVVEPGNGRNQSALSGVTTPIWPLAAALALLPLVSLARHVRRRVRARGTTGRCPRCGYNLTGNVSGVCPECGAPAATSPA